MSMLNRRTPLRFPGRGRAIGLVAAAVLVLAGCGAGAETDQGTGGGIIGGAAPTDPPASSNGSGSEGSSSGSGSGSTGSSGSGGGSTGSPGSGGGPASPARYVLTVTAGRYSATVTLPKGAVACIGTCTYSVPTGTRVGLVAGNPGGKEFYNGWRITGSRQGQDTCGGKPPPYECTVTVAGNMTATARYGSPDPDVLPTDGTEQSTPPEEPPAPEPSGESEQTQTPTPPTPEGS